MPRDMQVSHSGQIKPSASCCGAVAELPHWRSLGYRLKSAPPTSLTPYLWLFWLLRLGRAMAVQVARPFKKYKLERNPRKQRKLAFADAWLHQERRRLELRGILQKDKNAETKILRDFKEPRVPEPIKKPNPGRGSCLCLQFHAREGTLKQRKGQSKGQGKFYPRPTKKIHPSISPLIALITPIMIVNPYHSPPIILIIKGASANGRRFSFSASHQETDKQVPARQDTSHHLLNAR